jgi:hypothetical protein
MYRHILGPVGVSYCILDIHMVLLCPFYLWFVLPWQPVRLWAWHHFLEGLRQRWLLSYLAVSRYVEWYACSRLQVPPLAQRVLDVRLGRVARI